MWGGFATPTRSLVKLLLLYSIVTIPINREWETTQALGGHNPAGTLGQARTCPSVEELRLHVGQVERDPGGGQDLAVG